MLGHISLKRIVQLLLGVIAALLGLLWLLQGVDIIRLQPILCVANCEPITGGSVIWMLIGAATLIGGCILVNYALQKR